MNPAWVGGGETFWKTSLGRALKRHISFPVQKTIGCAVVYANVIIRLCISVQNPFENSSSYLRRQRF